MALSDYFNGPANRKRVQELESQLADFQERYAQIEVLAKKLGAMELLESQRLIEKENASLEAVRQTIKSTEQDIAALTQQTSELRAQVLVFEEAVSLY